MQVRSGPVFVVGTGRCGSTLLSQLLRDYSRALSLSEFFSVLGGPAALRLSHLDGPLLWHHLNTFSDDAWDLSGLTESVEEILWPPRRNRERSRESPLMMIPLPHLGAHAESLHTELREFVLPLPRQATAAAYSAVFGWLADRHDRAYWVERSGGSLEYVDVLLRHWPEARFVHIHRRGLATARSMSRHPFFRLRVARVMSRDPGLPLRSALKLEIPLDRFGAYWSAVLMRGVQHLRRLPPERVMHLAFEQLLAHPEESLTRLLTFLEGQPGSSRFLEANALLPARTERPWDATASELAALERACLVGSRMLASLAS